MAEALGDDHEGSVGELAELPPLVTCRTSLADALTALANAPGTGLPVLDGEHQLTGWLTHQAVLSALTPAGIRGQA